MQWTPQPTAPQDISPTQEPLGGLLELVFLEASYDL